MTSILRFSMVCLALTGVGAIVGFPLMAIGMAMAEGNASRPRR